MTSVHSALLGQPLADVARTLRSPQAPPQRKLPQLPKAPIPTHELFCAPVSPARRRAPGGSQAGRGRGRWKRMDTPKPGTVGGGDGDDGDSDDAIPLADLRPLALGRREEFLDYVLRAAPPEAYMQLSRPQQVVAPPVPEVQPPVSVGFEAFAARFERLDLAGLMDGTGQWPEPT